MSNLAQAQTELKLACGEWDAGYKAADRAGRAVGWALGSEGREIGKRITAARSAVLACFGIGEYGIRPTSADEMVRPGYVPRRVGA